MFLFEGSRGIQRGQGESKDTKGRLRWVNGGQELTSWGLEASGRVKDGSRGDHEEPRGVKFKLNL